jgi:hypothetical protein
MSLDNGFGQAQRPPEWLRRLRGYPEFRRGGYPRTPYDSRAPWKSVTDSELARMLKRGGFPDEANNVRHVVREDGNHLPASVMALAKRVSSQSACLEALIAVVHRAVSSLDSLSKEIAHQRVLLKARRISTSTSGQAASTDNHFQGITLFDEYPRD